ncbi:peptide-methionine (S)-S-oxide reductase MsrA [Thaumasiovibrio sp. DFM-14]|uniref:peptide-methionine (S)-S-oxide reductase MsrA n=1 Tax=Thaumasiovibrio sp. DFM-14 TaxID=3384792 RepID=UPI0039A3935B
MGKKNLSERQSTNIDSAEYLHHVLGTNPSLPQPGTSLVVGMGCFWGAERLFWQQPGVLNTAVGYSGGETIQPTYREVCTGNTGHTEVVLIHFNPTLISLQQLLRLFWENHDPTQGMRQGNDTGTQYRSAIYTQNATQFAVAIDSRAKYQQALTLASPNRAPITTEITPLTDFYFAEEYHQQYLSKHPDGYCGLKGTGIPML